MLFFRSLKDKLCIIVLLTFLHELTSFILVICQYTAANYISHITQKLPRELGEV